MTKPKKYKREYDGYGFERRPAELWQVVAAVLEHTMIEGVAERAEAQSTTVGAAFARLVDILHHKGLLTLEEVSEIAGAKILEDVPDPPEPTPREKRRPRISRTWNFDGKGNPK